MNWLKFKEDVGCFLNISHDWEILPRKNSQYRRVCKICNKTQFQDIWQEGHNLVYSKWKTIKTKKL